MNLALAIEVYAGGAGSGCNPAVAKPRCGRPSGLALPSGTSLEKNAVLVGYRRATPRGRTSGKIGAGTFYELQPRDIPREFGRKLRFDNLLVISERDVAHAAIPTYAAAFKFFPKSFFDNLRKLGGVESFIELDRAVAREARRRGFDGIRFGNREIVDLRRKLE